MILRSVDSVRLCGESLERPGRLTDPAPLNVNNHITQKNQLLETFERKDPDSSLFLCLEMGARAYWEEELTGNKKRNRK